MEEKNITFGEEVQKMEYEPLDETEMKLVRWSIGIGLSLLVLLLVVS
jgi:hypothetical protein